MKRAGLSAVVALLIGSTAALGAQSSTDAQRGSNPRRATSQTARNQAQEVTLTGCLMDGNSGAFGRSGAVGTTGSTTATSTATAGARAPRSRASAVEAPSYMLTGVSGATGTSGSAGVSGSVGTSGTSSSTSFMLIGPGVLEGHEGQQVEVKGRLMPPPRARASRRARSSRSSSALGTTGTVDENASAPRVRVTSVRMIAANCGGSSSNGDRPGSSPGDNR